MSKLIFTNNIQNYVSSQQVYSNSIIPSNSSKNFKFSVSQPYSTNVKPNVVKDVSMEEKPKIKSMKWGEPTWFLFHTLAEKIKDEQFILHKNELLQVIYNICVNLPCPECGTHAKNYLDKMNFNMIQNKQQLINMLFVFHNYVNSRKHFPVFTYDELREKYSKAITVNIIRNFLFVFNEKNKNVHMIANEMHRKRLLNNITSWFDKNIDIFNS